ncbi:MAG: biopolymer transporter ExbD [Planctomycetota bacterium]|nr:MAG: biopolymer transporter ExbD [Planctomycetota bacterium]
MRRKRFNDEEDPGIMMEPMIDCVFLLLIFFLVAATIRPQHREIPVQLPSFGNVIEPEEGHLTPLFLRLTMTSDFDDTGRLHINADGIVTTLREGVHGEPVEVSRAELLEKLAEAGQTGQAMFVETQRDMPYGAVVQAIGLLDLYRVRNLGLRFTDRYSPTF